MSKIKGIKISFEEISEKEAFEKIFMNDTDNLYFCYQFAVDNDGMFGRGRMITPKRLQIEEPIKYRKKKSIFSNKALMPEKQKNNSYKIYIGHTWLVKNFENDGSHMRVPEFLRAPFDERERK